MTTTDTAANRIPMTDKAWRVKHVIDTRQLTWEDGRQKPIPGSGDAHACDHCGRMHEVWATLERRERDPQNDGPWMLAWRVVETATVGVTCAKRLGKKYNARGEAIGNSQNWRRLPRAA